MGPGGFALCAVLVLAAACAGERRPAREIATREPAARSGRSRGPPWPCHRPPAPRPGPAFCSSPVPSGPSGALHTGGACGSGVPGQAPPPPTGTAARPSGSSGALRTGGAWCAGVWLGASARCPARPCRRPRVPQSGPVDQAARLSETAVACARECLRGRETGIAFAGTGRASTETGIAFAGENWVFLARFSVALVLSVSRGVVQGRAVVMVVSCWPVSVVVEVSLVSPSPPQCVLCAKKFALRGLVVG